MKNKLIILKTITLLLALIFTFSQCGSSSSDDETYEITGELDTTFGNDGVAVHDNAAGGSDDDMGNSVVLDSSGNIYVAGYSWGSSNDMAIWKYTSEGILDTTFNTNGYVVNDNAAGGSDNDYAYFITLDSSGNIYVTGYSTNSSGNRDMVIWKYLSTGIRDTTFGTDGYAIHDSAAGGSSNDYGNSIAIDNSGNIYVAGSSINGGGTNDMVIWKYTAEGILETTLNNTDGYVVHDSAAGGGGNDYGKSIALDSNGNIYVAGYSASVLPSGNFDMVIWKYTPAGIPDTTFDYDGIVVHDNAAGGSDSDQGYSIALDNSGNIYVAGCSQNSIGPYDMVIWKYTSEGILDPSFDDDGIVVHDNAAGGSHNDSGYSIALDISSNIYVAGYSMGSSGSADMVIWKYTPAGILDTTFNNNGIAVHNNAAGGSGQDVGYAIALDNKDNLYVTGYSSNGGDNDMVIWNYK